MRSVTDRRPASKSDARRVAILRALATGLRESDLDAINVASIAQQAGVSRSAFYFYFENKSAAVAALTEQIIDEMSAITSELVGSTGPAIARVVRMVSTMFDACEQNRHLISAMLQTRGSSASVRAVWDGALRTFVQPVADMIRAERSSGRAPDGLDAEVLATLLLEFNDRMIERTVRGDGALTAEQTRRGTVSFWMSTIYGLSPTARSEEVDE